MFGASGLGCLYADVTPEQANSCLEAVMEHGIGYIDTAPWYGAGLSESRLGDFLGKRTLPEGFKVSTKCGRVIKAIADVSLDDPRVETGYFEGFKTEKYHNNVPVTDYTRAGIMESFRQSCERLQVNTIHCLRLHDAETESRFAEATEQGGIDALLELRSQGKIREISLGFNSSEYLLRFLRKYPAGTFDNIMMAGCFNLIDQDGLELMQECQARGTKVVNVGIFASGVLIGGSTYKYGAAPQWVLDKKEAWKNLAEKHGLKLANVAMNFALLPDCVDQVAVGCKSAEKVVSNVEMLGAVVPVELWKEAKEAGLIAPGVPVPEK
jgi:D-threo-aldose 1-dehydrogenase